MEIKRIESWLQSNNTQFPSPLQHGYQSSLCSLMDSFVLQESINYCTERHSPVYVSFLDSATAFDTVWHKGLFVKLHDMGLCGKLWKLLVNSYTDMNNCIMCQGNRSKWIPVAQSVRQGSVMGPWYFMVYINDLLDNISNSGHGISIEDVY